MEPGSFEDAGATTPRQMGGLEKTVLGILLLLAFVLCVLFMLGRSLTHRNPKPKPGSESTANASLIAPPTRMERPALEALEAFFEAPDFESKASHVRDTERVRPMMEDYHQKRGHPFPTLGRVSPGHATRLNETPMVLFEVEPFSGPRYPVAVVWDGKRFAVDWESLTAYGTMDWIDFVAKQPASTQTLRVFIQDTPDEQSIPGIPTGHATFRVEHRDDPQPLLAAANLGVTNILKPLVERRRTPVTLEIAWQPIGPNGAPVPSILRLVAFGWSP